MPADGSNFAGARIKHYVERIQRVEDEVGELNDHKKEIYADAKAEGLDKKILRQVVKAMRKDPDDLREEQDIFQLYLDAARGRPIGGRTAAAEEDDL